MARRWKAEVFLETSVCPEEILHLRHLPETTGSQA